MRVGYVGGHWSSNVGNFYWNAGMRHLLQRADSVEPFFIPDPPFFWSRRARASFRIDQEADVSLIVLGGPVLGEPYLADLIEMANGLRQSNVAVGFLSAGLTHYSTVNNKVFDALNTIDPSFILTRDNVTYLALKDNVRAPVFSGSCASIFLAQAIDPVVPLRASIPYVLTNFESVDICRAVELRVRRGDYGPEWAALARHAHFVTMPTVQFPSSGRLRSGLRQLGFRDCYESLVKEWGFYSDNPMGCLAALSGASLVLSDRVHTVAATLAMGGVACFDPVSERSRDGRWQLLADLGLELGSPFQLDPAILQQKQTELVILLDKVIGIGLSDATRNV